MFSFDLPFLFIFGFITGKLAKNNKITRNINWILGLCTLFIFQTGGLLLWMNIISGSKEFMIIPFQIFGMSAQDFEPLIAAVLFGLEPILLVLGEKLGTKG
ncbi:hypothetical protein [Candidatus Hodarchaeum mangrovi]